MPFYEQQRYAYDEYIPVVVSGYVLDNPSCFIDVHLRRLWLLEMHALISGARLKRITRYRMYVAAVTEFGAKKCRSACLYLL